MIWEVSDAGRIIVVLESRLSDLPQTPQEMIQTYITSVTSDCESAGITLISDAYRVRQHTFKNVVQIFWNAQVPPDQVTLARNYLATLARSYAGE